MISYSNKFFAWAYKLVSWPLFFFFLGICRHEILLNKHGVEPILMHCKVLKITNTNVIVHLFVYECAVQTGPK